MRNFLALFLLLFLASAAVNAQDTTAIEDRKGGISAGINYLSFGSYQEYHICKLFPAGREDFWRVGLDLTVEPSSFYKFYFSGYYMGYEAVKRVSKTPFYVFGGCDLVLHQRYYYPPDYQVVKSRFGLGPFAGIGINIRKWLALSVEYSWAFGLGETTHRAYEQEPYSRVLYRRFGFFAEPRRVFSPAVTFYF